MPLTSELQTQHAVLAHQAIDVVIMAAGRGTRMKSRLPKVLHPLAGRPLLRHVLDTAQALQARQAVVVTGHGAMEVEAACAMDTGDAEPLLVKFVRQEPQLGTGHAVQQALPVLGDDGVVLILSGDVPLTQPATLFHLVTACGGNKLALLTLEMGNPTGYGRIVRAHGAHNGAVQAIVEQKDATPAQQAITEIYSGIMAVPALQLRRWLARLDNQNAQGEYYLTDIVKFAVADGVPVVAHKIDDPLQVTGVNSPVQLAELERAYQLRQAHRLMEEGVRLADPARIDVRGDLLCAHDVSIDVNCVFMGQVNLGEGVSVGANCVIANAIIEPGATIHPFTHIDGEQLGVTVGAGARIGPFARLRAGARLGADVHIGNFVEVKNATLAAGAKANHLAYLGDAEIGEGSNIGAGVITCNYDGVNKHRTTIGRNVFVGSDTQLVAPVVIGDGALIGAGSTITQDVPSDALALSRVPQTSREGGASKLRSRQRKGTGVS